MNLYFLLLHLFLKCNFLSFRQVHLKFYLMNVYNFFHCIRPIRMRFFEVLFERTLRLIQSFFAHNKEVVQ